MNDINGTVEPVEHVKTVKLTIHPNGDVASEIDSDIVLSEWADMMQEADRELRELPRKPVMAGPAIKTIVITLSASGDVRIQHDRNVTRGDWFKAYWTADCTARRGCMKLLARNEQAQTQSAQLPAGFDPKRLRAFGK
jgi:hypothetical protein